MDRENILKILKIDLQICGNAYDEYLNEIVSLAEKSISDEGIHLGLDDGMLVVTYAAFLYRKRKDPTASMPRMLRWMLNNRIMKEHAR